MKRLCGYRYAKIKGNAVTPFCINLLSWPLLTAAGDHKALFHFQVGVLRSLRLHHHDVVEESAGAEKLVLVSVVSMRLSSVGCRAHNMYGQVSTAPRRI